MVRGMKNNKKFYFILLIALLVFFALLKFIYPSINILYAVILTIVLYFVVWLF